MNVTTIVVRHEYIEGHHVFTSDQLRELLVVSKDKDAAFRDVSLFIKEIFRLRDGVDCEVSPVQPISEFRGRPGPEREVTESGTSAVFNREFEIAYA